MSDTTKDSFKKPAFVATPKDRFVGASRYHIQRSTYDNKLATKRALEFHEQQDAIENRKKQATESNNVISNKAKDSSDPGRPRILNLQSSDLRLIKDLKAFAEKNHSFMTYAKYLRGTSLRNPFGIKQVARVGSTKSDATIEHIKEDKRSRDEAEKADFQRLARRLDESAQKYLCSPAVIDLIDLLQFCSNAETIDRPDWRFLFQRRFMLIVADGNIEDAIDLLEKIPSEHLQYIKKLTIHTTGKRLVYSLDEGPKKFSKNWVSVKKWRRLVVKLKEMGLTPDQVEWAAVPLPPVGKAEWIDDDYLYNTVRVVELQCFSKYIMEPLLKFESWPAKVCGSADVLTQLSARLEDLGDVDLFSIADRVAEHCKPDVPESETWFGQVKATLQQHASLLDNIKVVKTPKILKAALAFERKHKNVVEEAAEQVYNSLTWEEYDSLDYPEDQPGYGAADLNGDYEDEDLALGDDYAES